MPSLIKVIDLFAGPGGLGEGFSSLRVNGEQRFKIALSIEKETSAHRTLTLRAWFRQYPLGAVPEAYYAYLRGELGEDPENQLYKLPEIREPLAAATQEAQKLELGKNGQAIIYRKIREALDGEDFILIGGPPCQAYSTVGRSRNYGARDKTYVAEEDHRNFLYREYLRIIARFQPAVFVMENVKGMLSAKVGGTRIFPRIREDLQNPSRAIRVKPEGGKARHAYRVCPFVSGTNIDDLFPSILDPDDRHDLVPRDFVIRAERFGIPQARHRVILLGIREDVYEQRGGAIPSLTRAKNSPSVRDVIHDLPPIRSELSKEEDSPQAWRDNLNAFETQLLPKLEREGDIDKRILTQLRESISRLHDSPLSTGSEMGERRSIISSSLLLFRQWYLDPRLGNYVTNHKSRGHMASDLHRYFYYAAAAVATGASPNSSNLPMPLWPKHRNFGSGKFADRFRVQLADTSGTTVTSHISKDGHYFIHFDPLQCRSLTVREAARIQTFPDNYHFLGSKTEQYTQVGNAVPPFLARQLAEVVNALVAGL